MDLGDKRSSDAVTAQLHTESDRHRRVVAADYVSLDDGSGIVHIAPAFGAEDFEQGRRFGLLFVQRVARRHGGSLQATAPVSGSGAVLLLELAVQPSLNVRDPLV